MNEQQYETLLTLAKKQLKTTDYETQWDNYVEGITDFAYSMGDYDTQNRLDNRLWLMWDAKVKEGMI